MFLLRRRPTAARLIAAAKRPGGGEIDGTDTARLARDQTWFLAIFVVKVALGLVAFAVKPWLGLAFLAAYAVYFRREMSGTGEHANRDADADRPPADRFSWQRCGHGSA
jgi:cation:H+ antiporter